MMFICFFSINASLFKVQLYKENQPNSKIIRYQLTLSKDVRSIVRSLDRRVRFLLSYICSGIRETLSFVVAIVYFW